MAKKLRVGVIFGGRSGEHEVSVRSAASVIESIDRKKYDVLPIAISQEGKWLSPPEASSLLPPDTQSLLPSKLAHESHGPVAILGDPSHTGLLSFNRNGQELTSERLDVVFPVLHGPFGEDGTIQGLLEMANIPYVGCGVLASACGMDKVAMKLLFHQAGLPMCRYIWFLRSHWHSDPAKVSKKILHQIGLPCFVKPANLGSSVGVSRADDMQSLERAVELAARYDRKIVAEEAVDRQRRTKGQPSGRVCSPRQLGNFSRLHREVHENRARGIRSPRTDPEVISNQNPTPGHSSFPVNRRSGPRPR